MPAIYPEIAKIARIFGDVTLRVTISETGEVTNVQPVSGHPLLTTAAQTAIRQWRYTPFQFGGHRNSISTLVVISFPGGLPVTKEEREKEKQKDDLYADLLHCYMEIAGQRLAKAEPICRRALASANALDPPDQTAKMEAFRNMGQLHLVQGKPDEALKDYQEALLIAEKFAKDSGNENEKVAKDFESDLAEAHVNVGNAKRGLDDVKGAVEEYEKAESIYRRIIKDPASERTYARNNSAFALWRVLRSHAEVLRQMGQPDAAASLQREAAGITIEEGPRQ